MEKQDLITLTKKTHKASQILSNFSTQDTVIEIKHKGDPLATFQIKGNSTTGLSNLKFEATPKKYSNARIGKAPLHLVTKLSKMTANHYIYDDVNNSDGMIYHNYPQNVNQYDTPKEISHINTLFGSRGYNSFNDMFKRIKANARKLGITIDFGGIEVTGKEIA